MHPIRPLALSICLLFAGNTIFTALATASSQVIPNIGSVTDPSSDCQISGTSQKLTIAIPGEDHNLAIEWDRMSAPRVLREVSGDFTAEVTVSGSYPEQTETLLTGSRPFHGAGLLLWVDSKTYIRLERAQIFVRSEDKQEMVGYPCWELRFAGKPLRMASTKDGVLPRSTLSLRMSRIGNKVMGAISEDGKDWKNLDPLTVMLPEKVQVGVAAVHNTTTPFTATFEQFSLQPAAKIGQDPTGVWILAGKPGEAGEPPAKGGRYQFFAGNRWLITQADPETGKVVFHHGGTFTLDGNRLVKTVDFANESTAELIHRSHTFDIKVSGDSYEQTGIDNPWSEVWQRVK